METTLTVQGPFERITIDARSTSSNRKRPVNTYVSRYVRVISSENEAVIYHALFGRPLLLPQAAARWLSRHRGREVTEITSIGAPEAALEALRGSLLLVGSLDVEDRIITSIDMNARRQLLSHTPGSVGLTLCITEFCNLSCTYCMFRSRTLSGFEPERMSWATASAAIAQSATLAMSRRDRKFHLGFTGGEPLIEWRLLERCIHFLEDQFPDLTPVYSLNTNGCLLTPHHARFLGSRGFSLAISLDGVQACNDSRRTTLTGAGTYRAVWEGLVLSIQAGATVTVSSVLTEDPAVAFPDRLLDNLTGIGVRTLSVSPDLTNSSNDDPTSIARGLVALRTRAARRGLDVGGVWSGPFDRLNASHRSDTRMAACHAHAGAGFLVRPNGNIRLCNYSAAGAENLVSWNSTWADSIQDYLSSRRIGNIKFCADCPIEGLCLGGCWVPHEQASKQKVPNSPIFHRPSVRQNNQFCKLMRECFRLMVEEQIQHHGSRGDNQ
jgi:uncharacterized protein